MLYPFLKRIAPLLGHFHLSFPFGLHSCNLCNHPLKSNTKVDFKILAPCLGPLVINVWFIVLVKIPHVQLMLVIEDFHTAFRSCHPSEDHRVLLLLVLGVFRDLGSRNGDKVTTLNLPGMDNSHLTL